MNKKSIISIGVILALGLIIFLKKNIDFNGLPELDHWEESVDDIKISKNDSMVHLFVKDGKWLINKDEFKADKSSVDLLAKALNDLKFIDFISKRKFLNRFGLDKENAISVVVLKNGNSVRDILLGRKNSTGKHVFVKFPDKPEIYTANISILNQVNKSVDDFRDKSILSISSDAINSISVSTKGKSFTISSKTIKESVKDKDGNSSQKDKKIWVAKVGSRVVSLDEKKVKPFLSAFNAIRANSFTADMAFKKRPITTLKINALGKESSLVIHSKTKDDNYLCSSSESDYGFLISSWKAKNLMKELKELK